MVRNTLMAWTAMAVTLFAVEAAQARQAAPAPPSAQAASPTWTLAPASATAPAARHENAAARVGDELFLIGGRGERPLDILDLKTGEWRRGSPPPMEINHTQAAVLDGRIFVIGALTGSFPEEDVVDHVLIYDPADDRWSRGAEIPAERRRGAGGLLAHEGVLYLVGGNRRGHVSGYVPWLDAFDPRTGVWTALPDAPHARDHFHAAVLDGRIYAAGGRTSAHDRGQGLELSVRPLDIYDIAERRWRTARDPIPTPRSGVSVVALKGRVLVLGGESDAQQAGHAEVEAYDPALDAWSALPDLPVGRHGTQAVVVGDTLHIVAGSGDRGGGPELNDRWILSGF